MRTTFRTITAVAGLAIGAVVLSGCGLFPSHQQRDDATLTDTVTSVRIDDPSGGVTLRGDADATQISIEREIHYWGQKREIGQTFEVSGDELVLSGCGNNCLVEYTIELPAGFDVRGRTSNGEIDVESASNVDVSTSNGRISLEEISGRIEASTSNGRIEGSELHGDGITAKTSNGSIELELDVPQDVRARTSNGSITVRVPDASYEVLAETSNGSRNIDIAHDPSGRFVLDLETSNGSINVRDVSSPRD